MLKLKLFACVTLLVPLLAYAGDVDCSGASEYSRYQTYKRDQRVWVRQGGSQQYDVYKCDRETCGESP